MSGKGQGELDDVGAVVVGGIDGESRRQLVTAATPTYLSSPVWSPDGRWIAYVRVSAGTDLTYSGVIEVRPAAGGPAKTLVSPLTLPPKSSPCNRLAESCLSWSPDWRLVFSVSQAVTLPGVQVVYSFWEVPVEPRTGEAAAKPERLVQWAEPVQASFLSAATNPTVTADGRRLSFLKNYSWSDVYLGELTPDGRRMKPARRFTLDNRGSYPNSWAPDSRAIIFQSSKGGKANEIFRQDLNQGVAEAIAQSSGKDCGEAVLTPDGSWILYRQSTVTLPGAPSFPSQLVRRPAAGGSPEIVFEEPGGMWWDYRCPPRPGSSCVLSRQEGKDLVFYALDPTRGRGEQLGKIEISPTRAAEWNIAPEGSRLALVGGFDGYQGRIEVLTFRDHAWHQVFVERGWSDLQSIAWTADGKGFFVTCAEPDFELLHVTAAGKVSPLLRNAGLQWMYNPVPSPDGKYLAFMADTRDVNVWLLENF